jgi:hypothetical protein
MPLAATLSRAARNFAVAVARRAGVGSIHPQWTVRAEICERCPLRVAVGKISYCGQPAYRKPLRDEAEEGCGCPTRDKAKDPDQHCPITPSHRPANHEEACDCKWCTLCNAPHAR